MERQRVWIIDPIDGTAGFIKKDGDFAVQIGLGGKRRGDRRRRVPSRAAIFFTTHRKATEAISRKTAELRNGFRCRQKPNFTRWTSPFRDHRSPKMSRIVKELGFRSEIGRGSVGVKVGMIAERVCDLYVHLSHRTKFWDTCVPQVILEEAGGRLTDIFGSGIRYDLSNVQNLNGILASNGIAHEHAVEALQPLLTEFGRVKLAGGQAK